MNFNLIYANKEFFNNLKFDNGVINSNIFKFLIPLEYIDSLEEVYKEINLIGKSEISQHLLEMYLFDSNKNKIPFEIKLNEYLNIEKELYIIYNSRNVSKILEQEIKQNKLIEELSINSQLLEQNANELIRLNEVISESEQQLKELNASKDKFFSIISHDLKNPFQTLIGYSDILASQADIFSTEEIKEISTSLNETTKNVYKLLENLLEWSRLQRGSMPLNLDYFDLYSIVNSNLEIVSPKAHSKNIKLINEVPKELIIFADINMINTVIRNLISNSLKFTNENGFIKITYQSEDNYHVIKIIDNGIGMTENIKNKLFKIDENVTTLGTQQETGTGLGLILVKELVNKNSGEISVESEVGVGTTFIIKIPKDFDKDLEEDIYAE